MQLAYTTNLKTKYMIICPFDYASISYDSYITGNLKIPN